MSTPVTMPQLGESVTEGTILRWLKAEGDEVAADEPLCEVETDKVTAELPSPFAGKLERRLVEEGTTVDVGVEIARLETSRASESADRATDGAPGAPVGEPVPEGSPVSEEWPVAGTPAQPGVRAANGSRGGGPLVADTAATGGTAPDNGAQSAATLRRQRSSPVVRRLAAQHGVSISEVEGTGLDGRVTRKDIEAYVRSPREVAPETTPSEAEPGRRRAEAHEGDEVLDLTATRRAIAGRMSLAKREAPHAWTMVEADVSGLAALREREKGEFERREGIKVTYLPFIVRAVARSLREHPVLNSVWDEDRIVLRKKINLGVAVDTPGGLVVPVIPDADGLSLTGLVRAIHERIERARSNNLRPEDVAGGTFTVNNPGALGSVVSTPIINYPQAAILSAEAVVKRPVVVEGDAIAVRSVMNLEVSFDHRILDGGAALGFLNAVKRRLEGLSSENGIE